jgi:uncharacterized protein YacL
MHCWTSCTLAFLVLVSMAYMVMITDKSKELTSVLNEEQLQRYKKIANERRNHMIIGYILGLALSIVAVLSTKNKVYQVCYAITITYFVSYFYYTLAPKSDYMVIHLETEEQRRAWLAVYLKMKNNYHLSFILGIVFVALAVYAA